MKKRRFYIFLPLLTIIIVFLIFLGEIFDSVTLITNILVAFVGIAAGFITNSYFAKKAEEQNLGQYASSGLRLSVDIYDSLNETIQKMTDLLNNLSPDDEVEKKDVKFMFEIITGRLSVIQRFSLSANDHWRGVLPPDRLIELKKRERMYSLSEEQILQITEERHMLQTRLQ